MEQDVPAPSVSSLSPSLPSISSSHSSVHLIPIFSLSFHFFPSSSVHLILHSFFLPIMASSSSSSLPFFSFPVLSLPIHAMAEDNSHPQLRHCVEHVDSIEPTLGNWTNIVPSGVAKAEDQRQSCALPLSHGNAADQSLISIVPNSACGGRSSSSAYALFFRDVQREVRDELGGKGKANFGAVSRAVAKRWERMGRAEKTVSDRGIDQKKTNGMEKRSGREGG